MMRLIRMTVVAAAVAAVAVGIAAATPAKEYSGPACTNFTSGDGVYSTFGGTEAILSWNAQTEAPTCANATYTLYVTSGPGGTTLTQQSLAGGTSMTCAYDGPSGTTCLAWSIDLGPAATAPSSICIYATSQNGNKVNDRAPDADGSCLGLQLDTTGSGGGGGFF